METLVTADLDMQILMLLENKQQKIRNSEIVKALWRQQQSIPPAFTVKVTKRLTSLRKNGLIERHTIAHKNVCYTITEDGHQQLQRSFLRELISSMPPIEIQVLLTLTHILLSVVYIKTPHGASLEGYIKILQDEMKRKDIIKLAKALINDPEKLYAKFYEHIQEFEGESVLDITE